MYMPSEWIEKTLNEFDFEILWVDEEEQYVMIGRDADTLDFSFDFSFDIYLENIETDEDFVNEISNYYDDFDYEEVALSKVYYDLPDLYDMVKDAKDLEYSLSDLVDSLKRKKVIRFKTLNYTSLVEADCLTNIFDQITDSYENVLKEIKSEESIEELEELNRMKERFHSELDALYRRAS